MTHFLHIRMLSFEERVGKQFEEWKAMAHADGIYDGADQGPKPEAVVFDLDSVTPREGEPVLALPSNNTALAALPQLEIDFGSETQASSASENENDGTSSDPEPHEQQVSNKQTTSDLTQTTTESTHRLFTRNAEMLRSDLNTSNQLLEHGPRALAESILRMGSLFQWGGTGITQHAQWQKQGPRRDVISPPLGPDGLLQVGPEQWSAVHHKVQDQKDQLNRKWANCAEQSGSLAHVIHSIINDPNRPDLAGTQVRQAYGGGHSWTEVQFPPTERHPDGLTVVYDMWNKRAAPLQEMPASYRNNVRYSGWHGRGSR